MRKETKNWWEQAKEDLKAAKINYDNKVYYVASFLSQQAAEKALKALLLELEQKIPKVHDLVFLAKKSQAPQGLIDQCDELTWVYIETRYPDFSGENPHHQFTKDTAKEHLSIAEEILAWVEKKI
ncbi:HEPN domain-containing protein [Candidatus Woesearchaeota archaeon]|nr:HEPN domain-containing protein [Candidatus Woesearchaeota archaeon]